MRQYIERSLYKSVAIANTIRYSAYRYIIDMSTCLQNKLISLIAVHDCVASKSMASGWCRRQATRIGCIIELLNLHWSVILTESYRPYWSNIEWLILFPSISSPTEVAPSLSTSTSHFFNKWVLSIVCRMRVRVVMSYEPLTGAGSCCIICKLPLSLNL